MKNGFVIVRNFINSDFSDYLQNYFCILYEGGYLKSGDPDAPNSPCIYGDPAFDCLMLKKKNDVEKVVGKNLIPQYSYSRIYQPKSVLKKHFFSFLILPKDFELNEAYFDKKSNSFSSICFRMLFTYALTTTLLFFKNSFT